MHVVETFLNLTTGNLTFSMSMYGYVPDGLGAHVSSVSLKEMTLVANNSTNATNSSSISNATNI
jgi:hypothetical protein